MPYNLITLLPLPLNFNKILRKSFKDTRKSLYNILLNGWMVDVAEYWNSWFTSTYVFLFITRYP